MALEDVTGEVDVAKFLGVFYGHPGSGKTNVGTAYPKAWGKALYFALDHDAYRLDSVLHENRERLYVLRFKGDNPVDNMNSIVMTDWTKDYPDARVMIVDTLTRGTKDILRHCANAGYFKGSKGDTHIQFGPKDAAITQSLPALADYGGAKWMVENWLDLLIANQAPHFHIILLCHEDYDQPKKDDPSDVIAVGGPATFGRKLLSEFPAYFPVIVRLKVLSRTDLLGKTTAKYTAISCMQGDYIARIKEGDTAGNAMPIVELNRSGSNWWDLYVANYMKGDAK